MLACFLACLLACCIYLCICVKKLWCWTVHGIEDLIGAVGHQPLSKTVAQAAHEVKSAGGKTANTAEALGNAALGKHLLTQPWQNICQISPGRLLMWCLHA